MNRLLDRVYDALMTLSAASMVCCFAAIGLGVAAREFNWSIQGLDAYAGYAIASALFFALPGTLRSGDHIRVSLLLDRLPAKARRLLEQLCLLLAVGITAYLSWFAMRLVWVSYTTHDVSPAADVTPLWIPQLSMALGCLGLLLAFVHAWVLHLKGQSFFASQADGAARSE